MESQSLHKMGELLDILERTAGEPGDLTSTLRHVAKTALKFFTADDCVIYGINPITGRFVESQTIAGDLVETKSHFEEARSQEVTQQVLSQGLMLVENLEVMPEYHSSFTRARRIDAFVGLALHTKYSQKPLGVLYLDFMQAQNFSPNDKELFQLFAVQVSHILQETWLVRRYREVARIGQEINHEFSTVEILFQKLRENVASILDTSYAFLLAVYQPQTSTLDMYMEEEGHPIVRTDNPLQGACQYVIEKQQTVFIRQYSKEAEHQPFQFADLAVGTGFEESLIFVPLVFRDVPLGVLSIQHQEPNTYNLEDLFILQLLANHIALALHNIRLYDNLSRLSETGQLLTQQLASEQVLQVTADKIRDATKADIVVLYPYEPTTQRFVVPPRVAGAFYSSSLQSMSPSRPDDIASLMVLQVDPIFAKESAAMYTTLHGDLRIRQGNFQERENIRSTATLPLRVGDVSVGVLFINFRHVQRFDASQKLLIEGLAHFAAIAIKNAQEYDTLIRRRVRELEILQDIDRELTRNLDLNSVLNTLLRLAQEHVPAEACSIMLPNPRTQVLEIPAARGREADARRATIVSLRETKGITRWVLEQKRPALVDNVHNPPWRDIYIPVTAEIVSELDVPLLDDNEVVGILNFESTKEGAFRQEDQDFLLTLAGQAVLAIKNAQAYEREKHLAAEAQALNQISKEITSQLDHVYIFDLILRKALELTHSTRGNLMLYDPERNDLWMAAEQGMAEDKKGQHHGLDQGIVGYVATHKQMLNVDLSQSPWDEIYLDFFPGTHSELAVPMLVGNELRGVLNVESPNLNNFNERDERLLQGLTDLAVIALQNAQAYEREKRFAEEGAVLNQISKEITSQLDLAHVFDLILERALKLTNSTTGALMVYDPDRKDLWMAAERGVAESNKNKRIALDRGIVGYAARTKQPLNVGPSQSPWDEIYLDYIPGTRSELAVPMVAGDELYGVLDVESPIVNNFKEGDVRLLNALADLAVVALQNARAFENEKRSAMENRVLNEISQEIAIKTDPLYIFQLILEKALESTRSTIGSLHLYDSDLRDLRMEAEYGVAEKMKGQRQKLGEGIVGYAAAHMQLYNVEDVTQAPWKEIYIEFSPEVRSEVAIPMLEGNELRGVLNVESLESNHFHKSDEQLLRGLADLAVVALQSTERYRKASREAQQTEMLYQAGRELANITDLEQLEQAYDIILRIAEKHSPCQVVIRNYDDNTQELVSVCASQYQSVPPFPRIKLDEGLNGQVARERRTRVIYDTHNPPSGVALKLSDTSTRSLVITPIQFKDRYYGNLALGHREAGYFHGSEISFFQGLADQLASTIYRLETVKIRQEFEQISSIGHSTFELTHRLANDLALVPFYTDDIQWKMEKLGIVDELINEKLNDIVQSVRGVLTFSDKLKRELVNPVEEEPVLMSPQELLKEALVVPSLPSNIQMSLRIDNGVGPVRVIRSQVADILRNLIANAIDAMPQGGKITLLARNSGHLVALEVTDTGVGIPPQHQSKIFDLSFSTKGGSGFGLWSSRRNALRNHGGLKVESEPGRTMFTLLLPRTDGGTV